MSLHGLRSRYRERQEGRTSEPFEGWALAAGSGLFGLVMVVVGLAVVVGRGFGAFPLLPIAFGLAMIVGPLIAVAAALSEQHTPLTRALIGIEIALTAIVIIDLPIILLTMLA